MNPLDLVSAINALLQLAANAGIAWTRLRTAIDAATAAGRPFNLSDLALLATQAQVDLDKLKAAIVAAGKPPP